MNNRAAKLLIYHSPRHFHIWNNFSIFIRAIFLYDRLFFLDVHAAFYFSIFLLGLLHLHELWIIWFRSTIQMQNTIAKKVNGRFIRLFTLALVNWRNSINRSRPVEIFFILCTWMKFFCDLESFWNHCGLTVPKWCKWSINFFLINFFFLWKEHVKNEFIWFR